VYEVADFFIFSRNFISCLGMPCLIAL